MKRKALLLLVFFSFTFFIVKKTQDNTSLPEENETFFSPSDAMRALDFWSAQRAYPHRVIPDRAFYGAFEYTRVRWKKEASFLDAPDAWTSIGPSNQGGRTIALAVDPKNPSVIYAGSASGGLWKLTLKGYPYTWEYIDTGFPVLGVNSIAIDPTDSKVIYVGTGEVYGYQNSIGGLYIRTTRGSYGIGLLKTTDGGKTWTKSIDWSYNQRRGVLCIRIHPKNPKVVFAGTTEGTFKSIDAGLTWKKVHSVLMAVDIAINPVSSNIIYVSCGNLGSPGSGIYRSMKHGEPGTWTKLGGGLPSSWTGKTLLAIYKASPNIVYADVADDFNSRGLYKSANHGNTWELITSSDYARYQGWFSHYVRVHPKDKSKIFCAGVDFFTSADGGKILQKKYGMHVDHHAYADHPTNPNIVYFGNDGGVYRTVDGGKTFQDLNEGYVTAQFYNGFSSSPTNPDLALGGLQDNSTVMYVGSLEWRTDLIGGDGAYTAINPLDNSILYGSAQNLAIYRSNDGGYGWSKISSSIGGSDVCFIAPYLLSPSHPSIMYAAKNQVYRSNNKGDTWSVLNNGIPLNSNAVLSLAVSHTNPEIVYAATVPTSEQRAEVFASINGGKTWKNITGDLPDRYYVDLQVSPHDDNVVYIALSGFGSSHLYRTVDGGNSWENIGNGLPDIPTSAVAVDPLDFTHIYVGNDLGVYVSIDYGTTWQAFNENLPTAVLVMDLSISPSNRKLRAVTHGNGVYERTLLKPTWIPEDDN